MAIHLFQWLAINWMIFVQSLPWKSAWTSPFPSIKKNCFASGSLLHTAGLPPRVCAAMSARSGNPSTAEPASGGTSAFFTSTTTFTSKSRRHLKACSLQAKWLAIKDDDDHPTKISRFLGQVPTGDWIQSPDSSPVLGCTKRNTASSAKQHRKAPSQQFSQRPVRN